MEIEDWIAAIVLLLIVVGGSVGYLYISNQSEEVAIPIAEVVLVPGKKKKKSKSKSKSKSASKSKSKSKSARKSKSATPDESKSKSKSKSKTQSKSKSSSKKKKPTIVETPTKTSDQPPLSSVSAASTPSLPYAGAPANQTPPDIPPKQVTADGAFGSSLPETSPGDARPQ